MTENPTSIVSTVERNGINAVPDEERRGTPRGLFGIWFSWNVSILGISYGIFVFGLGLSTWQAILAGLLGYVLSSALVGILEEELLFPANTQVALFVSMDVGKLFELDSVQVKLDDKVVTSYLYTPLEIEALHRGGVQRVYVGNLKTGVHEIVAFFTGKGPHDRDYKRGATVKFDKGTEAKYIELRIQDSQGKLQPEFDVKLWQ